MTFLAKLGQWILKGTAIVSGFAPIAELAMPNQADKIQTVSNDLSQIADLVVTAEAFGQAANLTGPQKAQFIANNVVQILLKSSVLANKKIANPDLLKQGAQEIAGGVADILNAVDEGAVKTQSVT